MASGGVEDGVGQLDGGKIEEMKQGEAWSTHLSRLARLGHSLSVVVWRGLLWVSWWC